MNKEKSKIKELIELKKRTIQTFELYHEDDPGKLNLFKIFKKINKSNKYLEAMMEDMELLIGSKNYPGIETLGKFLLGDKIHTLSDNHINSLKIYCEKVEEVTKIRKLKLKVLKAYQKRTNSRPTETLSDKFITLLENDIENKVGEYNDVDLTKNLKRLFVFMQKEHLVQDKAIAILESYVQDKKLIFWKSNTFKFLVSLSLGVVTIYFIFNLFFNSKPQVTIEDHKICAGANFELHEPRIVLLPLKGVDTSTTTEYAKALYERLHTVIDRDSLGIEVIYCNAFQNFENIGRVRQERNLFDSLKKQFQKRDLYIFIDDFGKAKSQHYEEQDDFFAFRERAISFPSDLIRRDKISEEKITFDTYHLLVRSLCGKSSKQKHAESKAIGYINNFLLLSNGPTKTDIDLLRMRSRLKIKMGNRLGSVEDLKLIYSLDTKNIHALNQLGTYFLHQKDPKATKYYSRYVELHPNHCVARFGLAQCYAFFNRDFQKAIKLINYQHSQSGKLVCGNNELYGETMGALLILEKDYERAISILNNHKLMYDRIFIRYQLAIAYYLDKQYEKAINELKSLEKRYTKNNTVAIYLALIYKEIGKENLAFEAFSNNYSGTFGSHFVLSHLNLERNNLEIAKENINSAIGMAHTEHLALVLNQRRVINNRLGNTFDARIDSLKIIDEIDEDFYRLKKYQTDHPYFKFMSLFGLIDLDIKTPQLIIE